MAVPYWIVVRSRPDILDEGVVEVRLTDGRERKSVVLGRTEEAKEFLEANAYLEGPDVLFVELVWYWVGDRRNSIPGWIPVNEVLSLADVKKFSSLREQDRKAGNSPLWT